ncbi:MAG: hypothetical protein RL607_2185 [Bacteroidota bacterium]|jgi:hypothetical protein
MKWSGYLAIVLSFWGMWVQAQQVTASVDSVKKKIGAEFKLTLKTDVRQKDKVIFPGGTTFGALEVLESYPVDTVVKNGRWELTKKYGVTQFDSGHYTLPKLPVKINQSVVYSNPLKVEVADVKVDTLKQKMYDIKGITAVPAVYSFPWLWIITLLGLVLSIVFYLKFKKRTALSPTENADKKLPPIEKATLMLQELDAQNWVEKGEIKLFYSKLTAIVRTYIEEEIEVPAMERTTSELIATLREVSLNKHLELSSDTLQNLEQVLRQADLVKFAKEQPGLSTIEADKKRIAKTIVTIHDALPEESEVTDELEAWNEQQRELARLKKEKKQRERRLLYTGLITFWVLAVAVGAVFVIYGYDNVKDYVLGNPTRELYEGQWIKSAYGDPNVELETPSVLTRVDKDKLPKNTYAVVKDMRMFTSGTLHDPFYVAVSTNYYKTNLDAYYDKNVQGIDYNKVLDGIVKTWEAQGARNILYKSDGDFELENGIKGTRAYGTMTVENKADGTTHRMYYEIFLFNQNGGLQQVAVSYEDGDSYGKKIMNRIINSIKLQIFNLNG